MKKKLLITSLLIALSFSIHGCSKTNTNTNTKTNTNTYVADMDMETDGTSIFHMVDGDTYYMETLPRKIIYDDKEFTLKSITFYEEKVDHAYFLLALVDFDVSSLTEDDVYWMQKDNDLYVTVSIDDEENEFDDKELTFLQKVWLSDGTYRYVFRMQDNYRYSLCGKVSNLAVYVTQGGKYEHENMDGEMEELDKKDTYYYYNCPIPEELETSAAIDEFTQKVIIEKIKEDLVY